MKYVAYIKAELNETFAPTVTPHLIKSVIGDIE